MKCSSLIFLTGFSGSGKSATGPLLAESLGYGFTDLDSVIELAAGKSVDRLFSENGEEFFRDLEYGILEGLVDRTELVVSLGGGALEDDRSLGLIKRYGTLVYLKASPEVLACRLQHKTDRPLIKGDDGATLPREELERKVASFLEKREPRYLEADIVVSNESESMDDTVRGLVKTIKI